MLSHFSCIPVTPWTMACQVPLCKGFSRQEYRSGLSFPSPNLTMGLQNVGHDLSDWTTESHVSIHCYSISQKIFTAWKILSAWPIHPPSSQPLAINDDFTVSVVLPFLGCHILEWYSMYSLSDWLISLSNMHLRFLHVFSWLLKAEWYSILCMYHS